MDMSSFLAALSLLADPLTIAIMIAATFVGMVVGALPGLGTVTALAIALPLTFVLTAPQAIGVLLAIYVSSVFGGSIPALLINVPGTPQSAATTFDGYPMTRKGHAAEAIGWATISSVIGGIFSMIVLSIFAPRLAAFAVRFGPVETFALIAFSLTTIAWVSRGSTLTGLLAGCIGVFLSMIGADAMSGVDRYTFGNFALSGGLNVVPLLIGLFALSEVFSTAAKRQDQDLNAADVRSGFKVAPFREWWKLRATLLRSSVIGTFLGILPGVGATAASLISYAQARASSPRKDTFGEGEPEGLVASETANNAVTGGALVPSLALGIPGDAATAVMLGALVIHGITPGIQLFNRNPDLVSFIFVALLFANLIMLVVGAMSAHVFSRILKVPNALVMAMIVPLSLAGSYVIRFSMIDVATAIIAGISGLILRYAGVPLAPIVIGFILGAPLETSLRQGLIITNMQPLNFFTYPIADVFFAITLGVLLWPLVKMIRPKAVAGDADSQSKTTSTELEGNEK
ncbi:tripartite tricarboxylate transporter permease [Oceanibium sediminis]|uniref:tripartite tricarboxylate transporter permease n=1 Tax=Oceanibium sediminis TaxID=2026339 RepID=UPI0018E4DD27|nr:tripartite tricarboxylate transporter permease [Oceanibium sediminis]